MTWDPSTSCGNEQDKIAHLVVKYLQGRALDLGCGLHPVWPKVIGVDNGGTFGQNTAATIQSDIADLSIFADGSVDAVFSSHALEDFAPARIPAVLAEWARVVRTGGYLCLYVPSANLYPKCGEPGANPAHKADIYPGDIEKWLRAGTSCGWTQVECEERSGGDEYSLFEVYQKRDDGEFVRDVWQRNPDGKKRALVVRYGAIGDQIVAASVLPELRKQGYHITYNTTPDAQQIVLHDPNIDEFLIQGKDWVPNAQLGPLWQAWAERYDLIVNLCESIEGALLKLPGRLEHAYPDDVRRRLYGTVNYLERTHDLAGVPHEFHARFHMSEYERKWARAVRRSMDGPVVVWALAGSSFHKIYPHTQYVVKWLLEHTPAHVVLMGDADQGLQVQNGVCGALGDIANNGRLHRNAGLWTIRQSLSFAQMADVVVGPETGLLNAVCMEEMGKVIYLSHSSADNLTRHWRNTITLTPDVKAACFPCHRLHYDLTHCHQDAKTKAALCAAAIPPDRIMDAVMKHLAVWAERYSPADEVA